MPKERIVALSDVPQLKDAAAYWFHEKWGIPKEAYQESIEASLCGAEPVPQWYLALEGERILAGAGVIENDFHHRKDLRPNLCALYVEEEVRCQGIAGRLLQTICADMKARGLGTLYLVTDHTAFYERYGWEFFCLVQVEGEAQPSRLYRMIL